MQYYVFSSVICMSFCIASIFLTILLCIASLTITIVECYVAAYKSFTSIFARIFAKVVATPNSVVRLYKLMRHSCNLGLRIFNKLLDCSIRTHGPLCTVYLSMVLRAWKQYYKQTVSHTYVLTIPKYLGYINFDIICFTGWTMIITLKWLILV